MIATDVSPAASPGYVVAVEGPNGSGKTTLLAAAAGLLPAGSARRWMPTAWLYVPGAVLIAAAAFLATIRLP